MTDMSKFIHIIYVFALVFSSIGNDAEACSCLKKNKEELLENCVSIYNAELESASIVNRDGIKTIMHGKIGKAKKFYKGEKQTVSMLVIENFGMSCDSVFFVGQDYLVCDMGKTSAPADRCAFSSPGSGELIFEKRQTK